MISTGLTGAGPVGAQDESPLQKRLATEAPPAWERYQDFFVTLEGTSRGERREVLNGKRTTLPIRFYWKKCNYNMLHQMETFESESWNGNIRGENSQYIFVLVRTSETKPWVIQVVNKKINKSTDLWEGSKRDANGLMLMASGPFKLPELFQSPRFQLTDVAPEPMSGEELVRLTFTYSPEEKERDQLRGGWIILDPAHDWVIRKAELDVEQVVEGKGKAKYTIEYSYKEGSEHHPIVTRSQINGTVWENERVVYEQAIPMDYDLRERKFIPDSEFTLSAYGLPEPSWAQSQQTPWYLWLGLAGILCLILGAGVGWLRWRRTARAV